MESKNFQQLEDENLQDDIFRTNSQNDLDKLVLEMKDKVGKTDNDLGTASKKSGGNFFSKLWAKMFGKKSKDISNIEIELNEIANDPLFADDGEGQKEKNKKGEIKKDDKEEKKEEEKKKGNNTADRIEENGRLLDEVYAELEKDEAEDDNAEKGNVATGKVGKENAGKGNPDNIVDFVSEGLQDVYDNFDENDNDAALEQDKKKGKKKAKTASKKASKYKNIEVELEDIRDDLGEDSEKKAGEEEIDERDEYVYDYKLHWGTTNLLHSFLYHKGEKYKFSEHGKIRNWFHKKLFGSYRSQEKSRRAIDKEKKRQEKEENESGRYYGDDAAYNRWEHTGFRTWFHDKWYHMKNAHRKAVDRFYNYQNDYRKMPWYQRAFWCVKNPLARIMVNFPRTSFGKQARENLLARMRKLYRQAISEGFIPKSDLGALDYDPLSGSEGAMMRASEQAQQDFEAAKLSATRKKNIDFLKAARANVLNNLMMINNNRDLVAQRCTAKKLDPKAGDREYLSNPLVRKSLVKHLNGLKKADWEIAKQEAIDNNKELPDEANDPAKNPIEIGEGDAETQKLIKLVNNALGLPEDTDLVPRSNINKSSEEFTKESAEIENIENHLFYSTNSNYVSMGLDSMFGYKIGGPALIGTDLAVAYVSLLQRRKALSKGDTIAARKHTANMIKYGVDVSDRIGGVVTAAKGLQGAALLVGPGTLVAGATDVYLGAEGAKQFAEVMREIEMIKAEEKQNSINPKILNMMNANMRTEKSSAITQVVAGVVNATGGALMSTGIFGTLGLAISVASLGISYVSNSIMSGRKKEETVKNVNAEMGLVERQRKLWEYYLKHGGKPSEYSRGMTKRAVLMEEGFEKGTRSQAAFQQQVNYAQKITDNINSDNPDPTYLRLIKSLKIEKGTDGVYHMEAVATALGADSRDIARSFLDATDDNEFISMAERMQNRNRKIDFKYNQNMKFMSDANKSDVPGIVDKALDDIAEKKKAEEKKKKEEEEAAKKLEEEKKKAASKEQQNAEQKKDQIADLNKNQKPDQIIEQNKDKIQDKIEEQNEQKDKEKEQEKQEEKNEQEKKKKKEDKK